MRQDSRNKISNNFNKNILLNKLREWLMTLNYVKKYNRSISISQRILIYLKDYPKSHQLYNLFMVKRNN